VPPETPFPVALLPRLNRFQQRSDPLVKLRRRQAFADRFDRLLGFPTPSFDLFHNRANGTAAGNVGTVQEHV
jgi:hypothetical protein